MNYTNEQIEKAVNILPEQIMEMLFLPETERSVQKIGIEKGLLIGQLKSLNEIVNLVIMGLIPGQEVASFIVKEINIPEEQAREVAEKALAEIIKPINDLREKISEEERKKREEEERAEVERMRLEKEIEDIMREDVESYEEQEEVIPSPDEYQTPIEIESEPAPQKIYREEIKEPEVTPQTISSAKKPQPVIPQTITPEAPRVRMPDVAPVNLPTETVHEEETATPPFMPPIPPKTAPEATQITPEEPSHPFEEKMKRVLTPGPQAMNELSLDTPKEQGQKTPQAPRANYDPYREPIE